MQIATGPWSLPGQSPRLGDTKVEDEERKPHSPAEFGFCQEECGSRELLSVLVGNYFPCSQSKKLLSEKGDENQEGPALSDADRPRKHRCVAERARMHREVCLRRRHRVLGISLTDTRGVLRP